MLDCLDKQYRLDKQYDLYTASFTSTKSVVRRLFLSCGPLASSSAQLGLVTIGSSFSTKGGVVSGRCPH